MNYYPTETHEKAASAVIGFLKNYDIISSVLLICSCARGEASPDSCIDFAVLLKPEILKTRKETLERDWNEFNSGSREIKAMLRYGKFAHVDLEFINGVIPENDHYHEWMSGPDSFEIEIGNYFAYSVPLLTNDDYFETLKSGRLPYYTEDIRRRRLAMVKKYCINNLEHIEPYVRRGLYFQAFDRFYNAFREFLQALFISKRTYPICYEKWIKEQIVDILGLPELYTEILSFFHIDSLESDKMIENMKKMYGLMDKYILIE